MGGGAGEKERERMGFGPLSPLAPALVIDIQPFLSSSQRKTKKSFLWKNRHIEGFSFSLFLRETVGSNSHFRLSRGAKTTAGLPPSSSSSAAITSHHDLPRFPTKTAAGSVGWSHVPRLKSSGKRGGPKLTEKYFRATLLLWFFPHFLGKAPGLGVIVSSF